MKNPCGVQHEIFMTSDVKLPVDKNVFPVVQVGFKPAKCCTTVVNR